MRSDNQEKSLEYHLNELKSRFLHSVIVFVILSGAGFLFSAEIMQFLQMDLNLKLHTFRAYEAFYTQLMIALLFGFLTSLPVIVYQFLKFAEPGLKKKEYRIARNFLPFSYLLFLTGFAFSYQFVVKTSLEFFKKVTASTTTESVWGLQTTLGLVLKLSAASGILFQIPIVALVLGKAGLLTADTMRKYRAYFFIAILIVAAMATPPDIVTQFLITMPVLGLYQISIFLVERVEPI